MNIKEYREVAQKVSEDIFNLAKIDNADIEQLKSVLLNLYKFDKEDIMFLCDAVTILCDYVEDSMSGIH